jgi:hypothetical protein
MPIMESLLNQAKNVDVLSTAKCPKDRQEKSVQRSTYPIRRFLPRGCNLRNTDVPSSSSKRGRPSAPGRRCDILGVQRFES